MELNGEMPEPITLREYVDLNFELRDRALKIQHDKNEDALRLAHVTLEHRLEGLNELRGNVLTKNEFDAFDKDVSRRLEALERWQARLVGIGIVVMVVSGLIGAALMRMFNR